MKLDHIAIWTKDLEKLKEFYLKYFGCQVNNRYENNKKQFSSYFLTFSGGTRIELMHRSDVQKELEGENLGYAHICIAVGTREKVDSLTKKMENEGIIVYSQPRLTGDGYYESVILDPENNKIELCAMDGFEIKPAEMHDLEEILYLQKCCYLSEAEIYINYSIGPLTQNTDDINKEFKTQTFLKLFFDNRIIGSVRAFEREGTCFIGKLIVDRYYQNMGFGKLLLHSIEKTFEKAERFELFTGHKSIRNLNFYYKQGYQEFKEEHFKGFKLIYLEKCIN